MCPKVNCLRRCNCSNCWNGIVYICLCLFSYTPEVNYDVLIYLISLIHDFAGREALFLLPTACREKFGSPSLSSIRIKKVLEYLCQIFSWDACTCIPKMKVNVMTNSCQNISAIIHGLLPESLNFTH